ncbi:type II secretion system minor pseudopilin GspI [Litoribacillus peritrichatus]|uniref:Type II secretion system protein I n=1 Tax=Litoribacillus peritrichatus TaxID=718191 RepID=A0ABP7MGT8_9GAMM
MKTNNPMRHTLGFTLIEVMIALIIFSVVAVSVGRSASIYINNAARLELKTEALIVAEQELNKLILTGGFLPIKNTNYDLEIGEKTWVVNQKVSATEDVNMRRVELSVSEKGGLFGQDHSIINLSGFVGRNSG